MAIVNPIIDNIFHKKKENAFSILFKRIVCNGFKNKHTLPLFTAHIEHDWINRHEKINRKFYFQHCIRTHIKKNKLRWSVIAIRCMYRFVLLGHVNQSIEQLKKLMHRIHSIFAKLKNNVFLSTVIVFRAVFPL